MPARRLAIALLSAGLVAAPGARAAGPAASASAAASPGVARETRPFPVTGESVPGLASFDREVLGLMERWGVPGGALAVTKDDRLVYARGFGYADVERGRPVSPDALFRVGSVSKTLTATAILKLVETGKLRLEDRVFPMLPELTPPAGTRPDPRLARITVRDLLNHSAGWDRLASLDPMFAPRLTAQAVDARVPADARTVIRFMRGRPLEFSPGGRFAYSNFGYALLGRVVERASGVGYEEYVRSEVLAPLGITRMRIGRSRPADRPPEEVRYYDAPGRSPVRSVFPSDEELVAWPDGGFHIEALDSAGGWTASAIDLVRFMTAVDGLPERPDILEHDTLRLMWLRPQLSTWMLNNVWYGLGWYVRPDGPRAAVWHGGTLFGTTALLMRITDGRAFAAVFNTKPEEAEAFLWEVEAVLRRAASRVDAWPRGDDFPRWYPGDTVPQPLAPEVARGEASAPPAFVWDPAGMEECRVIFSTDALAAGRVATSGRWSRGGRWTPDPALWRRAIALAEDGGVVYWRVEGRRGGERRIGPPSRLRIEKPGTATVSR
ncbi:MAG: beta-lactamase family protein [Acidobacteria bacterium]|jgi:N-acyl-D-amino-acid deacylase|nr:beta-lactamase family protein [Acidobacteriota bacterium]